MNFGQALNRVLAEPGCGAISDKCAVWKVGKYLQYTMGDHQNRPVLVEDDFRVGFPGIFFYADWRVVSESELELERLKQKRDEAEKEVKRAHEAYVTALCDYQTASLKKLENRKTYKL